MGVGSSLGIRLLVGTLIDVALKRVAQWNEMTGVLGQVRSDMAPQ